MAETILELVNVSKYYTGAQSVVMGLNSVSLRFERGEFVAVTGESGSGKSTLAQVMGGILPYESGEMLLMGRPTSHYGSLDWERWRRDNVSFISQSYGILPGATVMRNVMSALILTGMDKGAAKTAAGDILRRVDLWEMKNRRAAKLSSGQKQRLSIARALAKPAPILIADEPTGNLDAENSRKIIGLLADAAKERLVILVTHDFDEARDLVTRHVVLQNGAVAADTVLRPSPEPGPVPQVPAGKKRGLGLYVARLQCVSRPVWTGIMALFFAITAFAVFAFFGVFLSSLDDTNTKIYDGSAFPNGDPTRIVVLGKNLEPLTEEDFQKFLSVPHVESVETWANIADVRYAYREGVDYDLIYEQVTSVAGIGEEHSYTATYPRLHADAPFARTVPVLREGETFLTVGRAPENMFEVVCGDGEHQLDDILEVMLVDPNTMSLAGGRYFSLHFKVVGLTDYGDGLFFHNDLGRFFRQVYAARLVSPNAYQDHGFVYIPNDPYAQCPPEGDPELWLTMNRAQEGHFIGGSVFYSRVRSVLDRPGVDQFPDAEAVYAIMESFALHSDDTDVDGRYRELALLPTAYKSLMGDGYGFMSTTSYPFSNGLQVTYDAFDTLCWHTADEAGITISDYAYTDQVLKELDKLGYSAISVYRQGSTKVDPQLAAERTQTLRVCILALLVTAVLQVVVLRAMFSAEYESFRLLGNIGLTGRTAKRSVVYQIAFFTLLGELLGAGGIYVCYVLGVRKIVDMLKYMPWPYLILLAATHMALSAAATVWVISGLTRQVYPLGSVRSDLELEDGEEVRA